ncbi:MAG TPA: hypothetical protein PLT86_00960 [Candidatus Latescibacteria bacterium]|nr:hypothetical protein [Candidatus Latescibacterota bacterium]HPC43619.1 hypothetical protein [Candidatus Latescibacterota bacterium]HQK21288.1 hypothetical protein [Candidatus Latescibacterota bacterium]
MPLTLHSTDERTEVQVRVDDSAMVDPLQLRRDVIAALQRSARKEITLSLEGVAKIDTRLLSAIKMAVTEARIRRRRIILVSAPAAIRFALSGTSFRVRWAAGLFPLDTESPAGALILNRYTSRVSAV